MAQNNWTKWRDDELVEAARIGDRAAFNELMLRHYRPTLSLATSILRSRDEAEDEAQNAWCKAWEHLAQFQGDAKFSTWVTRIVVNQCLMRLRQLRRARLLYLEDTAAEDRSAIELPDESGTAEQHVGRRQVERMIVHEIGRIPPLLRNVMMLRDVSQLPMAEVAARLGISVAAAKSRLLRARIEMRSRLERHCGRQGPATLTA